MLKKRIRKLLQVFVLGDTIDSVVAQEVSKLPATHVVQSVEYVTVQLEDGDILVFPSSISSEDFREITSAIGHGRRVGIAAADNISIIKLS